MTKLLDVRLIISDLCEGEEKKYIYYITGYKNCFNLEINFFVRSFCQCSYLPLTLSLWETAHLPFA